MNTPRLNAEAIDVTELRKEWAFDEKRKSAARYVGTVVLHGMILTGVFLAIEEGRKIGTAHYAKFQAQAVGEFLATAPKDFVSMNEKQKIAAHALVLNENERLKSRLAEIYVAASEIE